MSVDYWLVMVYWLGMPHRNFQGWKCSWTGHFNRVCVLIFENSPGKWSTPTNGPCVWVCERVRVKIWRFKFSGNKVNTWTQQKLIPSKISRYTVLLIYVHGYKFTGGVNGGRVNILIQELLWLYIAEAHIRLDLGLFMTGWSFYFSDWSSYLKVMKTN